MCLCSLLDIGLTRIEFVYMYRSSQNCICKLHREDTDIIPDVNYCNIRSYSAVTTWQLLLIRYSCQTTGGPTCVHDHYKFSALMSLRSRDNVQANALNL